MSLFFSGCLFVRIFAAKINRKNYATMKVKLTKAQIEKLAQNPDSKVDVDDPWWVIVLKVIVYAAGLLLAGVGTVEAAALFRIF